MKTMTDDTWTRRGINFLWDNEAFARLAPPANVLSFRSAFQLTKNWQEDLPANNGKALVVAGLDVILDLMKPSDAEIWVNNILRPFIQQFQAEYDGEGSLVFWLPGGAQRITMNRATEQYSWRCVPPFKDQSLEIGRLLWSGAEADVSRIINAHCTNQDTDGAAWIGLHHPRVS